MRTKVKPIKRRNNKKKAKTNQKDKKKEQERNKPGNYGNLPLERVL